MIITRWYFYLNQLFCIAQSLPITYLLLVGDVYHLHERPLQQNHPHPGFHSISATPKPKVALKTRYTIIIIEYDLIVSALDLLDLISKALFNISSAVIVCYVHTVSLPSINIVYTLREFVMSDKIYSRYYNITV